MSLYTEPFPSNKLVLKRNHAIHLLKKTEFIGIAVGIEKARSNKIFVKPRAQLKYNADESSPVLPVRRCIGKANQLTRIDNSQVSDVGSIATETKRAMKEEGVCLRGQLRRRVCRAAIANNR